MDAPARYRWDAYGQRKVPGPWYVATPGKLRRAFRAMRLPQERLRIEFESGINAVFRPTVPQMMMDLP